MSSLDEITWMMVSSYFSVFERYTWYAIWFRLPHQNIIIVIYHQASGQNVIAASEKSGTNDRKTTYTFYLLFTTYAVLLYLFKLVHFVFSQMLYHVQGDMFALTYCICSAYSISIPWDTDIYTDSCGIVRVRTNDPPMMVQTLFSRTTWQPGH